jgi:hypothetical protein
MAEVSISLPFTVDSYGKIKITTDYPKLWADRVRARVGTGLGERVMRPEFGGLVPFMVFNGDEEVTSTLEGEIGTIFSKQLPLLSLSSVSTTFDEYTGSITAIVVYGIPDGREVTTNVGIVTIRGKNPTAEETK